MTDKGNGSVPEYEEKGFLDKVKGYGRAIGRPALEKAFLAYHVLRDPDTPAKAKAILGGSLAYLVMPVDAISDFLPLSYAVDAMSAVATKTDPFGNIGTDLLIIAAWIVVSLALGSLTLRRRSA